MKVVVPCSGLGAWLGDETDRLPFAGAFSGKTVFVTGHTGFKGSWLCEWLLRMGAWVHGFSLEPPTDPALFDQLNLASRLAHETGDVRDIESLKQSLVRTEPDFVFHLAAQPLVRLSYEKPLETFSTNVMGTAHLLEALRLLKKPCAAVMVTTDKCYENIETDHAYSEEDPLGGHDPYSSSKAAAEIVIGAYRRSFFEDHPVRIASARAGNVIGGGDWALDRIVPDCIRSLQRGEAISVRNPAATRPWQHVLEPLSGYLWLAASLAAPGDSASRYPLCAAFNFGPEKEANRPVSDLVAEVLKHWPGRWEDTSRPDALHEARLLMLSTARAKSLLRWQPVWNFEMAIGQTVDWYRGVHEAPGAARELTLAQITQYEQNARDAVLPWAAL